MGGDAAGVGVDAAPAGDGAVAAADAAMDGADGGPHGSLRAWLDWAPSAGMPMSSDVVALVIEWPGAPAGVRYDVTWRRDPPLPTPRSAEDVPGCPAWAAEDPICFLGPQLLCVGHTWWAEVAARGADGAVLATATAAPLTVANTDPFCQRLSLDDPGVCHVTAVPGSGPGATWVCQIACEDMDNEGARACPPQPLHYRFEWVQPGVTPTPIAATQTVDVGESTLQGRAEGDPAESGTLLVAGELRCAVWVENVPVGPEDVGRLTAYTCKARVHAFVGLQVEPIEGPHGELFACVAAWDGPAAADAVYTFVVEYPTGGRLLVADADGDGRLDPDEVPGGLHAGDRVQCCVTLDRRSCSDVDFDAAPGLYTGRAATIDGVALRVVEGPDPPTVDSLLECAPNGWIDPDFDPEGYRFGWFADGAPVQFDPPLGTPGTVLTSRAAGALFGPGSTVTCRVATFDGTLLGGDVSAPGDGLVWSDSLVLAGER